MLMRYMVVERFRDQNAKAVYDRLKTEGRKLPDGLRYEESWVAADCSRCFQVVQCDDIGLLQRWVAGWQDLIEFEILPIQSSEDTVESIQPILE